MSAKRETYKHTFEKVPELYDQVRPSYPPALFDDLVALARLQPEARLLEIGAGTGKATLPLVDRGYSIKCLEMGQQLAAVARRKIG